MDSRTGAKRTALLMSGVIFLVALNLRPAIVAVGPLLSSIGAAFEWGESLQGLLGALPLLAFALFSIFVSSLTAKFDTDCVLFWALIVLAVGCFVRSFLGENAVWAGTLLIGASIAVGNVLAPAIVKRDFVNSISFATGAYSACVTSGSAIAGLTASAAADALGGWQPALALWAVPALAAAALWFARSRLLPACSEQKEAESQPARKADDATSQKASAPTHTAGVSCTNREANLDAAGAEAHHAPTRPSSLPRKPSARSAAQAFLLACHALHGTAVGGLLHVLQLASQHRRIRWLRCNGSGRAPVRLPSSGRFLGVAYPPLYVCARQPDMRGPLGKRAFAGGLFRLASCSAAFACMEHLRRHRTGRFVGGGSYPYLAARHNPR